ncbi:MAG: DNA polymerase III subunit delta [Alphaproteobacteria bacterium]|nr:DNA polymerase III subunit delta [Alphaproteobacteria bacterium]
MIVKSGDADRYVERIPKTVVAALIFGPDQGLVRERAEALAKTIVSDLRDPFRVTELDEATLNADKARLADEAAAISMLGGRRVVRVRGAGNSLAGVFDTFLDDPKGDALVIVEAGDLAKSSSLRKVFEGAGNAAAIPCYADTAQSIAAVLRHALKTEGLTIAPEALDDAAARLGSDRGITRREVEKLALYMHGKKHVELADVRAVMGDESEIRAEEACDAAGEGDLPRLDLALERLWSEDASPTAILRPALSHFQRLLQVKAASAAGESVETAMKRGWPQIHFTRTTSFKAQVSRWSEEALLDACDLLFETEALTRTTAIPAEVVTSRALFTIAAMARRR